ncbi:histidine triad nucleotide-binding protein [Geotalea sp. SG265]|uniref:histidine triad nucleotide-binding protein n=1 Tax=Geotalea sp. SG265 TaxID=2922867 RepID=UPI001FAF46C6|nr:histidine triad nucleotide-binding protein [Geotalea sp. SG265]
MSDCLFCKMIKGEIPVKPVYEDDQLLVINDIAPVAPQHLLVIPKKHLANTLEMQVEDEALVGHVFRVAAIIAREKGIAEDGFRIVNNNNAGAGQSVYHIHFHLVGGRHFNWPPG